MKNKKMLSVLLTASTTIAAVCVPACLTLTGCSTPTDDVIELRVSNWEEYIDLGDWDEDELIELEDGTEIIGENSLVDDFEEWFYETYGKEVHVSYSTFGTNEELYNQMTIGDEYDLVCPSEYMIMKMLREDLLEPYSEEFFDTSIETNYYANNVSPYIKRQFDELTIVGEKLSDYTAGYMWGTLGIVYNPEYIDSEAASTWKLFLQEELSRKITIKDSVRDSYFAAQGINAYDEITSEEFLNAPDYHEKLSQVINRTDAATVDQVEEILSDLKDHVYSFETDSGKADMVTGKVYANLQWSGDAVYTLDQAEEDDVYLCYSAPEEATNLWFDGWVMLKNGVGNDPDKKLAAEAFVNFLSMQENAIRNMYYIGYTSVIAGTGDHNLIYQYLNYNYEAEDDEEETIDYQIGYFFTEDGKDSEDYLVCAPAEQANRQLYAQYPPREVMERSVIMACFDEDGNERINRMWTNVRCFDLMKLFGK